MVKWQSRSWVGVAKMLERLAELLGANGGAEVRREAAMADDSDAVGIL